LLVFTRVNVDFINVCDLIQSLEFLIFFPILMLRLELFIKIKLVLIMMRKSRSVIEKVTIITYGLLES